MDWNQIAALADSTSATINNVANSYAVAKTSKQDRKFMREMSELAWERNLQAWHMQNEYNLPINAYARQLEGLQANGLNPNLVYGSGSTMSTPAGSVSPYRFENYHSTGIPQLRNADLYSNYLQTRLLETQVAAQEANNRLVNARAENESARTPGLTAKSNEAAARWNYISTEIADDQEAAWRAQVSLEYWKGVQGEHTAHLLRDRSNIMFYEAAMAQWLNTEKVPGTDLTYRQYVEQYKTFMSSEQYEYLKNLSLDIASRIAFRAKQGELIDLKKEYQGYVNKFAKLGRGLGNDWFNVLFSGLESLLGGEDADSGIFKSFFLGPIGALYDYFKGQE